MPTTDEQGQKIDRYSKKIPTHLERAEWNPGQNLEFTDRRNKYWSASRNRYTYIKQYFRNLTLFLVISITFTSFRKPPLGDAPSHTLSARGTVNFSLEPITFSLIHLVANKNEIFVKLSYWYFFTRQIKGERVVISRGSAACFTRLFFIIRRGEIADDLRF